ncbi:hypothetical protein ACH4U7_12505 [Streptomyces sp. NPDC020845]|uniref:hypothetical protein n=1 Tax=Streptomyces sp. NPDC020845 TaxID=3365096 RepID=UPI00379C7014
MSWDEGRLLASEIDANYGLAPTLDTPRAVLRDPREFLQMLLVASERSLPGRQCPHGDRHREVPVFGLAFARGQVNVSFQVRPEAVEQRWCNLRGRLLHSRLFSNVELTAPSGLTSMV